MNGNGTAIRASGAAIRAIRVAQGRGIRQLADDTGLTRGYLSRLETGLLGASPETIAIVAACLDVPIEAISYPDRIVVQVNAGPDALRRISELLESTGADKVLELVGRPELVSSR